MRVPASLLTLVGALVLVACSGPAVQQGDRVLVTYVGRYQNGSIFDSNDPSYRDEVRSSDAHFTPLSVRIGAGELVPGVEAALLGMREGETKTVTVKAAEGYGGWDPAKTKRISRMLVLPLEFALRRHVTIPLDEAEPMQAELPPGQQFQTKSFWYNVTAANRTHIDAYILNWTEGAAIDGWNCTFTWANATALICQRHVEKDGIYTVGGAPYNISLNRTHVLLESTLRVGDAIGAARITQATDLAFTADANHPLAGKDLTFTLTVNAIGGR